MICPDCQGKGGRLQTNPHFFYKYCSTCNGFGITHCCDGDQVPSQPQLLSPDLIATADLPTDPHAPTS